MTTRTKGSSLPQPTRNAGVASVPESAISVNALSQSSINELALCLLEAAAHAQREDERRKREVFDAVERGELDRARALVAVWRAEPAGKFTRLPRTLADSSPTSGEIALTRASGTG